MFCRVCWAGLRRLLQEQSKQKEDLAGLRRLILKVRSPGCVLTLSIECHLDFEPSLAAEEHGGS
jgi:hypothetical protein